MKTLPNYLQDWANAIREKKRSTGQIPYGKAHEIKGSEIPNEIHSIMAPDLSNYFDLSSMSSNVMYIFQNNEIPISYIKEHFLKGYPNCRWYARDAKMINDYYSDGIYIVDKCEMEPGRDVEFLDGIYPKIHTIKYDFVPEEPLITIHNTKYIFDVYTNDFRFYNMKVSTVGTSDNLIENEWSVDYEATDNFKLWQKFYGCGSSSIPTTLRISPGKKLYPIDIYRPFEMCYFTHIDLTSIDTSKCTDYLYLSDSGMWHLKSIGLSEDFYKFQPSSTNYAYIRMRDYTGLDLSLQANIDSFYNNLYDRTSNGLCSVNLQFSNKLAAIAPDSGSEYAYIGQRMIEYGYTLTFH